MAHLRIRRRATYLFPNLARMVDELRGRTSRAVCRESLNDLKIRTGK